MITQELAKSNAIKFWQTLKDNNGYSQELFDFLNKDITIAPSTNFLNHHGCYEGGLIRTSLLTTKYIILLNGMLLDNLKCDKSSLIRIALLSNIGKTFLFTKTAEDWKIKKGILYEFNDKLDNMSICQRSMFYCLSNNVKLSEKEVSAILSIEKENDKQIEYFNSTEGNLLLMASKLAIMELKSLENNKSK